MKYSMDGKQQLCSSCFDNQPQTAGKQKRWVATDDDLKLLDEVPEDPTLIGRSATKRIVAVHGKSLESKPGRVKYLCVHCRYSFTINRDSRLARNCPNCGTGDPLEVTDVSVNDLLH